MRREYLLFAIAAIALAGCKTTDTTGDNVANLDLCGINCPPDPDNGGGGGGDPVDPVDPGGGNTTGLNSGAATIALQKGVLDAPATGTSLSDLEVSANGTKAVFQIDTKTASNGSWPTVKTMNEYVPGSQDVDLLGGTQNLGADSYREYRAISATTGQNVDEVLQVWNFGHSRSIQYRTGTGIGDKQAWAFDGESTSAATMPVAGTATFTGRYGSTAEASNWIKPDAADFPDGTVIVNPNLVFSTNGSASIQADFGSGDVNGTLRPEKVRYFDENGVLRRYDIATNTIDGDPNIPVVAPGFFATDIGLKATIDGGNTYSGTANLGDGFVSGDNPVQGGFFGDDATETTGVFAVKGVSPAPVGGTFPIVDDRRGYLSHSGTFNATCQPGATCAP